VSEDDILDYVRASAALLALPLDEARAQAVAVHLGRTAGMARLLGEQSLAPEDELAEIYRPAPFPPEGDE
jgi:hypothetical protein